MPKTEKKIIPKKNKPPFFFANYDQRSIHILKFDPVIKQKTLELWDFVISSAKRSTDRTDPRSSVARFPKPLTTLGKSCANFA
jgi:hypothetical protein